VKSFDELPKRVLETMEGLGNFSPTSNFQNKAIKGWIDGKTYFDSKDLREMAEDFVIVANWLDERAEKCQK
jgi:hypothetical protein